MVQRKFEKGGKGMNRQRRIQLFVCVPAWLVAVAAVACDRLDVYVPDWIGPTAVALFLAALLLSWRFTGEVSS
jgi:hypothetical protein